MSVEYIDVVVRIPVVNEDDGFSVRVNDRKITFRVVEPYISPDGEYMKDWKNDLDTVPNDVLEDVLRKVFNGDVDVIEILR